MAVDIAHMPVCLFLSSVRLISWVNFRVRFKEKGEMSDCFRSTFMKWGGPGCKIWIMGEVPAIDTEWPTFVFYMNCDSVRSFSPPKFIDTGMECSSIFFPSGWSFLFSSDCLPVSSILLCPLNQFFPVYANCMFISENVNTLNDC